MGDIDFEIRFTGLYDINKKPIMDGDIVFWDDCSQGEWSRIAVVEYKKPHLHFRVVACPSERAVKGGIIGHKFNFGNFIYTDTHNHLEIINTVEDGLLKAKRLREENSKLKKVG